jgi:segregation and condensation protein A
MPDQKEITTSLHIQLNGYDGPLDLLLDLARNQKIDITQISIISLVDQYLAVIEDARMIRLELAADWLVMAATLAWLRSRLLLPPESPPDVDADAAAAALAARLAELDKMRIAAEWLSNRPQLGRDIFARGAPENMTITERSGLHADLPSLIQAYINGAKRSLAKRPYRPKQRRIFTVQNALERLGRMVTGLPNWSELKSFVPGGYEDPVESNAAIASTLIASLELAKIGELELQQDQMFSPIRIRARRSD